MILRSKGWRKDMTLAYYKLHAEDTKYVSAKGKKGKGTARRGPGIKELRYHTYIGMYDVFSASAPKSDPNRTRGQRTKHFFVRGHHPRDGDLIERDTDLLK